MKTQDDIIHILVFSLITNTVTLIPNRLHLEVHRASLKHTHALSGIWAHTQLIYVIKDSHQHFIFPILFFVKITYNFNYIVSSTQLFKGYSAKYKTQYLIFNIPSLLKSYFTDIVPLIFMMLSTGAYFSN